MSSESGGPTRIYMFPVTMLKGRAVWVKRGKHTAKTGVVVGENDQFVQLDRMDFEVPVVLPKSMVTPTSPNRSVPVAIPVPKKKGLPISRLKKV